jgi:short subunit dehydrogenase-like uncharacterized protein
MRLVAGALTRGRAGPSAKHRARGQALLWGEVTCDGGGRAEARLRTPDPYALTAASAVEIARRVLAGEARPGFQTPSRLLGPDFALELPGVTREDVA